MPTMPYASNGLTPASIAADDLHRIGEKHDSALRHRVRERTDEGGKHDVGQYEEHLQHRRLPFWRVQHFEQCDRDEQQRIVGKRGEELSRENSVETASHGGLA